MARKVLILTEGLSSPNTAKSACSMIRYRRDELVGVLDTTVPPQTCQGLFEVGGDLPVVNSLDALPEANVLLIGIAPSGGSLPAPMRELVLAAIKRGMDVESGLHEFFNDDAQFAAAASASPAATIFSLWLTLAYSLAFSCHCPISFTPIKCS